MWERRTFHQCAEELGVISDDFRAAYTNRWNWDERKRNGVLSDSSRRGVEILRILALSIRSDQDYGRLGNPREAVGALDENITEGAARQLIREYRPPYTKLAGFKPLALRQALNKIAHVNPDPSICGFFADDTTHDLLLTGTDRGRLWACVLSLIDFCVLLKSLPDYKIPQAK